MTAPLVLTELRDGIVTLRFNRPPANPLNLELGQAVMTAIDAHADDSATRALILTGTGACFSGGIDLKAVPSYRPDQLREMILTINRLCLKIYSLRKPFVTAVDGHAIGGGLVIALMGDYRLVTRDDCKLGLAEVRAGIPFPACPMEVVKAELRPDVARRLSLTAWNLGPATAFESGLFDEIVDAEHLLPRAQETADELARLPRSSYGVIKHQLRAQTLDRMRHIVEHEADPLLQTWVTAETKPASEAILQK